MNPSVTGKQQNTSMDAGWCWPQPPTPKPQCQHIRSKNEVAISHTPYKHVHHLLVCAEMNQSHH